jgi:hypothetical protein
MVTLIAQNTYSQITINKSNNVQLSVTCDQLSKITPPMASSSCDGELNFTYKDNVFSGGCMGTIERIWSIRDNCNNTSTFQQFIRLIDDTPPRLSNYPKDVQVSANNIPSVEDIIASDNCTKKINVVFNEVEIFDDKNKLISIKRTWKAEDQCGNIASHTQTILINNTAF